jgi:TatD DNase family protein
VTRGPDTAPLPAYFDTHCHLTHSGYPGGVDGVLVRARRAGVKGMVAIGMTPDDCRAAQALAVSHPEVWATAGIHPCEAHGFEDAALAKDAIDELRDLARAEKVVAVGETGLDFHWDDVAPPAQERAFRMQLALASELSLPVIIHMRKSADALLPILAEHAASLPPGIFHCYGGNRAVLDKGIEWGWYFAFGGSVTYGGKDGRGRRSRADQAPPDRLLLETDSPYMTPEPHREEMNEPARLPLIAEALGAAIGEPKDRVARLTWENAHRVFGIEVPDP